MALRRPGTPKSSGQKTYVQYDEPSPASSSHKVDVPTNFVLSAITLEDIDQAVYQEFNNRFVIMGKQLPIWSGDAETTSLPMMNYEGYDAEKGFMAWPFFIFTRTATDKKMRTNPAYKQVIYQVPMQKPQGIVIEEYVAEGPIEYELVYDFKFVTYFRQGANELEEQMNYYFRNKRNIIVLDNERFSIGPANGDKLCEIQLVNRDDGSQMTMYVLTFTLKMWCWTRGGVNTTQKRERPNSYTISFSVKDRLGEKRINNKAVINVDDLVIRNKTGPDEPTIPGEGDR